MAPRSALPSAATPKKLRQCVRQRGRVGRKGKLDLARAVELPKDDHVGFRAVYQAADGREYEHFTIVYVPTVRFGHHSTADHRWINECVAVGGRILMLFEANSDEVFVEAPAAGPP